MKRRILCLILIFALCLLLAACGSGSAKTTTAAADSGTEAEETAYTVQAFGEDAIWDGVFSYAFSGETFYALEYGDSHALWSMDAFGDNSSTVSVDANGTLSGLMTIDDPASAYYGFNSKWNGVPILEPSVTEADTASLLALIETANTSGEVVWPIYSVIAEEASYCFTDSKPVEDVCAIIQNRVQLYLDEQS